MNKRFWSGLCFLSLVLTLWAEDGSRLWLRQTPVNQASVCCLVTSPTLTVAREELAALWQGGEVNLQLCADEIHRRLGKEGYTIRTSEGKTVLPLRNRDCCMRLTICCGYRRKERIAAGWIFRKSRPSTSVC